jgi:hypothetical protein
MKEQPLLWKSSIFSSKATPQMLAAPLQSLNIRGVNSVNVGRHRDTLFGSAGLKLKSSAAEDRRESQFWLEFAGIEYDAFRAFVATGATEEAIAAWIGKRAKKRPRAEVIAWNNKQRELRLSELPAKIQEYMENYILKFTPRNRVVYVFFDVYDLEEQRL